MMIINNSVVIIHFRRSKDPLQEVDTLAQECPVSRCLRCRSVVTVLLGGYQFVIKSLLKMYNWCVFFVSGFDLSSKLLGPILPRYDSCRSQEVL